MLEMLINFERSAPYFSAVVMLCLGIVALAAGLVLWLAGMALRRLFLFIAGAVAGAILGLYFVGRKAVSAAGLAALCAVVAAFLDKFFVIILAAALAVAIAISIMAWHYDTQAYTESVTSQTSAPLNGIQTLEFIRNHLVAFVRHIGDVYRQMPNYNWLVIPVLIVLFIAAGIFCWNLICAWLCATAGTICVFAGMISFLLYRGSSPITTILHNGNYYAAVFTGMMMLGTILQLLLFHHIKRRRLKAKTQTAAAAGESPPQKGWRGL